MKFSKSLKKFKISETEVRNSPWFSKALFPLSSDTYPVTLGDVLEEEMSFHTVVLFYKSYRHEPAQPGPAITLFDGLFLKYVGT